LCDDFESGLGNWTVSGQDWGSTTTASRSPNNSFTDSPTGNFLPGSNAATTLAGTVDLRAATAPMLRFWHKAALQCASAYVEISDDGGLTWSQLGSYSRSFDTTTWSLEQLDLATHAGSRIKLRFRLQNTSTDPACGADGWYIDDVEVWETDINTAPPNTVGGCAGPTTIRYFCDSFESGLGNWWVSGQNWNTTVRTSVTGAHSFTDSPNGDYPAGATTEAVLSGTVDLTGATSPVLTFWQKLGIGAEAFVRVEISSDAGATWQLARSTGTSENSPTWSLQQLDLRPYVRSRVKVRFRLAGGGNPADGWYIDDVEVRETDIDTSPPNTVGGCSPATTTRYFCDSFESGLGNWWVSGQEWAASTALAVTGSHSLSDSPSGSYLGGTNAAATLAGTIDLGAASSPVLTFWHKLVLGMGGSNYAYVEVSTNGGLTWSQLVRLWYSSNTTTWSLQQYDLSSYVGSRVKVRFRLFGETPADGWDIDDVEVRELF
jgi:hypothetical protein